MRQTNKGETVKSFILSMLALAQLATANAWDKRNLDEVKGFKCTISRYESAITCFAKLGEEIQDYEEENTVAVSSKKRNLN